MGSSPSPLINDSHISQRSQIGVSYNCILSTGHSTDPVFTSFNGDFTLKAISVLCISSALLLCVICSGATFHVVNNTSFS